MHPLRLPLHNELHARPSIYFSDPAHVYHLTLLEKDGSLEQLLRRIDPGIETEYQLQGLLELNGCRMKWELHTEFLSLTFVVPRDPDMGYWPEIPECLRTLIIGLEHLIIESSQILVESQESWAGDIGTYGFKDPAGSQIGAGDATAWSDFRLCGDGPNRILLLNRSLNAYRLGRMVRRILEIETYRMMASLALPVAKDVASQLRQYEAELCHLSDANASQDTSDPSKLLQRISALSARIVRCDAKSRQRFSACEAYAQIVFERIAELREVHVVDRQRLGTYIERRFRPGVRYCTATQQRLERLSGCVANLGELLQARVQVEMEEQNCAILQSLNARAISQLKIQRAVEGLSLIAISYYLLSLSKLLYEGLDGLGVELSPKDASLYLAPLVLATFSTIVYRVRKAQRE